MKRRPFIAGNWKMHKTYDEALALVRELKKQSLGDISDADVAVCPPFPFLKAIVQEVSGTNLCVGAQNMHWEEQGAFTGEVSASMLSSVGVIFVILGHSERRHLFGETDEMVNKKVSAALRHGLKPIVCVGETLEERDQGKTFDVVLTQCRGSLKDLDVAAMSHVTIAYEPVWAIGTGRNASGEQAQEVHHAIRAWLQETFGEAIAQSVRIQYGGSVKPDNIASLIQQPDIDGALVGGASLKADSFTTIVQNAVAALV